MHEANTPSGTTSSPQMQMMTLLCTKDILKKEPEEVRSLGLAFVEEHIVLASCRPKQSICCLCHFLKCVNFCVGCSILKSILVYYHGVLPSSGPE